MRPFVLLLVTLAALAAPSAAAAGSDVVVRLNAEPAGPACDALVAAVVADHDLRPATVYTSALCGFAASVSKADARALAADPRVLGVEPDRPFASG